MLEVQVYSWFTVELVLGIVGTVTGILGLVIHFVRFMRERPQLRVEVRRCQHRVATYKSTGKPTAVGTLLEVEMRVNNRGDWRTTLNDAQLLIGEYSSGREKLKAGGIQVLGHATQELKHSFFIPKIRIADSLVDCSIILYHTHGRQDVRVASSLRGA